MRSSEKVKHSPYMRWLRDLSIVTLFAAACILIGTTPLRASCGFAVNPRSGNVVKTSFLPLQGGGTDPALVHDAIAHSGRHRRIEGLWYVVLTMSTGGTLWQSFQQYHPGGLELESADLNPLGGNFCVGVWKQRGSTVKIYHVGWTYDGTEGNPNGSFVLTETSTLSKDGNSYNGTFVFTQYDSNGDSAPAFTLNGTLTGQRIDFSHPYTPVPTP